MVYALVKYSNSCEAMLGLVFGTLAEIKNTLVDNDSFLLSDICEGMDRESIEKENEVDDYYALFECDEPEWDLIANYDVSISDCETSVIVLSENYEDIRDAFKEYAEERFIDFELPEMIEEVPEVLDRIDSELRGIGSSYLQKSFKYLKPI